MDNYIKEWELDKKIKTATPSRADIMSFYSKGVIDETTARDELSKLGYSDKYIEWYFAGTKKAAT
jgi:beta-lactamase class A